MFDYNTELAIKETFLFQYVLADAVDAQDIFALFCDIYCVRDNEREEIVGLLDDKRLNDVRTVNDYYRAMRLKEYYQNFVGGYDVYDERIEALIAIKGEVFEKAQKDKLLSAYEKSCGRSYDEIFRLAYEGVVSAKRILGILQVEGVYITQDVRVGLDNLRDCADWLDIQALVTSIYYCEAERQGYLNELYTVTQKTEYAAIVELLQIRYGIENCNVSESAKMLDKAFIIDNAKREVCSLQHLRILRSNTLSDKDKRTVLLSGNKELVPAVCGLPLRLECEKIDTIKEIKTVLSRNDELTAVMRSFDNNDLRNRVFYRSLCICSNSEYVRDAYVDWICGVFAESNIVQIDVASLLPIDFDATENNVFIRKCTEKEDNIYIIKITDKIDERIVRLVKLFATSYGRKAFALSRLGVSIDLSAVLPIFICDRKNAQLLDGSVNMIKAADICENEKSLVFEDLLNKKRTIFAVENITLEDDAKAILLNASINIISDVLDQAILSQRIGDGSIRLSAETVKEYIGDKKAAGTYGFGGSHAKK